MNHQLFVTRRENKMKQKDVAKMIGIHPQSYHLKESGKRQFTIEEGLRLAKLFNCTLDYLFGEENKKCIGSTNTQVS